MENDKTKLWLIPLTLMALFFISIFDLPYGFYTFFRIVVFALSLFFGLVYYGLKGNISFISILSFLIAVLWNPIIPVYLDEDTWVTLDIVAIFLEAIMIYPSYKLWKNTDN